MTATRINIKALPGRVVRVSRTGKLIPDDKFITVKNTPYLDRLVNHWGDAIAEPYDAEAANAAAIAATKTAAPIAAPTATTATTATSTK